MLIETDDIDIEVLKDIIYTYFYNGPIAGASVRLAKIIRNHLAGLPLLSFDEVLNDFLASEHMDQKEGRALFWKSRNNVEGSDETIVERFIDFARRKSLLECVAERLGLSVC